MVEIRILSPSQRIYIGQAKEITFPGEKGQFQILENHANLFSTLKRGEIIVGKNKKIRIVSGVVGVSDNKILALVEI